MNERKTCVSCKHYREDTYALEPDYTNGYKPINSAFPIQLLHRCVRPIYNVITGEEDTDKKVCTIERANAHHHDLCGEEGRYWEKFQLNTSHATTGRFKLRK